MVVYLSTGLGIGIVLGFLAGRAFQAAHRAWKDYTVHKAMTPALRAAAWLLTGKASGVVALAAGLILFAVYIVAGNR
ncbi:MAG: hypothetical protein ACRDT4_06480 [Micromonosporaceae bacterium]